MHTSITQTSLKRTSLIAMIAVAVTIVASLVTLQVQAQPAGALSYGMSYRSGFYPTKERCQLAMRSFGRSSAVHIRQTCHQAQSQCSGNTCQVHGWVFRWSYA